MIYNIRSLDKVYLNNRVIDNISSKVKQSDENNLRFFYSKVKYRKNEIYYLTIYFLWLTSLDLNYFTMYILISIYI